MHGPYLRIPSSVRSYQRIERHCQRWHVLHRGQRLDVGAQVLGLRHLCLWVARSPVQVLLCLPAWVNVTPPRVVYCEQQAATGL
jgi:hypothetical protein